jgi:hypothetical protein
MSDISTDLHEALAHYDLVPETMPLIACSTEYRQRFRDAIWRAYGGDPDELREELDQMEHRLLAANKNANEERELRQDYERRNAELRGLLEEFKRLTEPTEQPGAAE